MKNLEIQKAAKSYEKSSFSYKKLLLLAAEEGFEPSQTESESVVLPLHNSASNSNNYYTNFSIKVKLFFYFIFFRT